MMNARLCLSALVLCCTSEVLAQAPFLRNLIVHEREELLELQGDFGDAEGVVYINHTARALAGDGWSSNSIEVQLNPQDVGEVYVQVGDQISNARWITAWDFTVTRHETRRAPSVCGDCFAHMTWRFRLRGDIVPYDYGGGQMSPAGTVGPGVRGATFSLDEVTGTFQFGTPPQTHTLTRVETAPAYFPDPTPPLGGGEWFSTYAGVYLDEGLAVLSVHVDTDGTRLTNQDTGDSRIEHITFFGVFHDRNYPNTLVVPVSPSLNIPAGSTPPDALGSSFEWQAAPVQSPPPSIDTDVEQAPPVPGRPALEQNHPNPFHSATRISFSLPEAARVRLDVYDVLGRHVDTLVDEVRPAGRYAVTWQAASMPGGVYFSRLQAGAHAEVSAMTLIR